MEGDEHQKSLSIEPIKKKLEVIHLNIPCLQYPDQHRTQDIFLPQVIDFFLFSRIAMMIIRRYPFHGRALFFVAFYDLIVMTRSSGSDDLLLNIT